MDKVFHKRFLKHLNPEIVNKLTTDKTLIVKKPGFVRVSCSIIGYDHDGLLDMEDEEDDTAVGEFMDKWLSGIVTSPWKPYEKFDLDTAEKMYYFVEKRIDETLVVTFYTFAA